MVKDIIYPVVKDNCTIHASFNFFESNCRPFHINYDNELKFIGEVIYFDESRNQGHHNRMRQVLGR